jgi:hypothetical protein
VDGRDRGAAFLWVRIGRCGPGGPVSEACGQCGVAAVDLCEVVDSLTRPVILGADLEEQTRACR